MNAFEIRDSILQVLLHTYASDLAGKNYYAVKHGGTYQGDVNIDLTTNILALFVEHTIKRIEDESLGDEIRNMIWMTHSGGGTASAAAARICTVLGVDYDRTA